ncbi:glycosyltransferase [Fulvimarina sp. 2208YS6-2-32]|uniref:Glycosyltransferase n=1 Tax=Fulvimarina uroteuthidis TaxID=3098149 RepID=A0ABU5I0F1_9HYPH|nr:glycosyltransferase [Fulvimarina sp. 2208YS6-2-32]MDY8108871.1 glycosyltransferase [Fulvimarina sp. 2208YS6-2-32]
MTKVTISTAALHTPRHIVLSAWLEHVPFLSFVIERLRPARFVELGTHLGYSYFAACETVKILGLGTNCHAIDTFMGDEHAGFYDDAIHQDVVRRNADYSGFSSIHRMTFAEALDKFEDNSVDLLHIDGRHFYDDVKEDYETWTRKLTANAVVLFHDTNVRERDFGVWKLFAELKAHHPTFEFFHNHGLGVLAFGEIPPALSDLFALEGEDAAGFRKTMETLGQRLSLQFSYSELAKERARLDGQVHEMQNALSASQNALDASRTAFDTFQIQHGAVCNELENMRARYEAVEDDLASMRVRYEEQITQLLALQEELTTGRNALRERLSAMETSTLWRSTTPIRRVMERMPTPVRRLGRGTLRAAYWASTPHLIGARIRHFRGLVASRGVAASLSTIVDGTILDLGANPLDRRDYGRWIEACDRLDDKQRKAMRERLRDLTDKPLISIVMPVYNTPEQQLREAVASVTAQIYENWELCIADDASPKTHVARVLKELANLEPRIRIVTRETNGHIALASNSALELAKGEFVALMDHDDILAEHALYEIVATLNDRPDADILYSDEDKIDENGERFDPYFKPDFSYDQLLGQNVINHLGVYRRSLLDDIGGFRDGFTGSQDHDLALRSLAVCGSDKVVHIPKVLYHWRQTSSASSFSQSDLQRCIDSSRKALREHLGVQSDDDAPGVQVLENPIVPIWNRVKFPVPADEPLVSVIIPTRDRSELVRQCVEGLLFRTDYKNLEIIIVDNDSEQPETFETFDDLKKDDRVRVLQVSGAFNYSRLNNLAAKEAKGEVLLLLNNDIDVISDGWLTELVSHAIRPDIGCVGAKLLYADGRIQHAGVRLGAGHFDGGAGVAGHLGLFFDRTEVGYFGSYAITRDVGCVTAACLAVRRDVYLEVEGLNETNLTVAFNDVDFCLRVREAGYRILWTPFAELYHLESASRGSDESPEKHRRFMSEARYMRERWGKILDADPFYNPNFDNYNSDFSLNFARNSITGR